LDSIVDKQFIGGHLIMQTFKTRYLPIVLVFLAILSMSCGLANTVVNGVANKVGNAVTGGGDAGTVAELWPDVPKMDGLKQENLELPLTAKLALQGVMNATTGGKGTFNFIAFTTTKNTQDVVDFYTNDKMTSSGWNQSDQAGCVASSTDTSGTTPTASGGICFFGKTMSNNKDAMLGIFIAQDSASKQTQVFFMRVEATIKPTATP